MRCDIAIIGGGILGVSLSYFLAFLNPNSSIVVIEREDAVAEHASGRNTGKVHAPYLYDPDKKRVFARAAHIGYSMWQEYTKFHNLPFRTDGVAEVALEPNQTDILEEHYRWGLCNGLSESDMRIYHDESFAKVEPEVTCQGALVCHKDASVDYAALTRNIMADAQAAGVTFLLSNTVKKIKSRGNRVVIETAQRYHIDAGFVINAAGGQAVDISHRMNVGLQYSDMHFRGEYWHAPAEYNRLTSMSIYSVPHYPEYPFLDPHWIMRADGSCEVGPNAVLVFSPYGYDVAENIKCAIPKTWEMIRSGIGQTMRNPAFRHMIISEMWSSVSKRAMINRVRRFLRRLDPAKFVQHGTAGIRSSVVDDNGIFVADPLILEGPNSVHILNYNSPGATGALPFAIYLIDLLQGTGAYRNELDDAQCGLWQYHDIINGMKAN